MVVGGCFAPATPVLVPEVGRGRERQAVRTIAALRRAGRLLRSTAPDALVVVLAAKVPGLVARVPATGALRRRFDHLDAPELEWADPVDPALTGAILERMPGIVESDSDEWPQDALTGLYFIAGRASMPSVCLQLPADDLTFATDTGRAIRATAERRGGALAVLAVGELSSRLFPGAPGGDHTEGASFDAQALAALEERRPDLLPGLVGLGNEAGQSALAQLAALLAAVSEEMPTSLLSYESPFGVGYAVATLLRGPDDRAIGDPGGR
jgi:hypothetical protein